MIQVGTIDRPWLTMLPGQPALLPYHSAVGAQQLPPAPMPSISHPLLKTGSAAVISPLGLGVLATAAVVACVLVFNSR
jgi:hypothetical protein